MYTIAKIDSREDKRDYEIFETHTREQVAQNMTKENAELICYWLNACQPGTTASNPVKVASVCEPSNPTLHHVPMASVTVIKNEEQYSSAYRRLQELMTWDIPKGSLLENDVELLQIVLEKYENDLQEMQEMDYEEEETEEVDYMEIMRDQFAIEAMKVYLTHGVKNNGCDTPANMHNIGVLAYEMADAMIDNRDN